MKTLKPCPFCGGKAELVMIKNRRYPFCVECSKCGATSGGAAFLNAGFIAEEWNKRV